MNQNIISGNNVHSHESEENGPLLDDKLIDITPNITVIDGFEEENDRGAICAKCRTISNSLLASTPFPQRSRHSIGSMSSRSNLAGSQRFHRQVADRLREGDDTTLINAYVSYIIFA